MHIHDRRRFFQLAVAGALGTQGLLGATSSRTNAKAMQLGLLVNTDKNPEEVLAKVHQFGLPTAHVEAWNFAPEMATRLRNALDRYQVQATVLYSSVPRADTNYNLSEGPSTFGMVPPKYRSQIIDQLKRASDFAKRVGIPAVFNQWGFIPEDPKHPWYKPTVEAVHEIASHCKANGQMFMNETGQETPITLLRTIQDAGVDNIRVILDAANLVLYGKGNPVDSLVVIGHYIRGVHAKGGFYPTDPRYLGKQVPASQHSEVDWPTLIQRLKAIGYHDPITIEAVTPASQRNKEILDDKIYLEKLIA